MLTALVFFSFVWAAGMLLALVGYAALYLVYKHDGGRLHFFQWVTRI